MGELTESSTLSVALFKLYIENVTRNAAKTISGAMRFPYTKKLKITTKDAFKERKSDVEVIKFRILNTRKYEFEESNGKKIPVVKNPNNCVVLCSGCDSICPAGAIKHPAKKQARELIRMLRGTYRFQK